MAKYLNLNGEELPSDVAQFVRERKLNIGDVVNFSDYRDEESFVICSGGDSGEVVWIKNPDEYMSGWLTIPERVTRSIPDVLQFYKKMIESREMMNIHVNRNDKTIKDKFGKVPDWEFDYWCEEGKIEIHIKTDRKGDWLLVGDVKLVSRKDMEKYVPTGWTPSN